jgi:hypothetical protein
MTDTAATPEAAPADWALVELMGHRRRAGRVQEVERFGAKMLRIDIPAGDAFVTEFYGGSAIYAMRPATEEIARATAEAIGDPRPVAPLSYRLPAPAANDDDFDADPDDSFDIGLMRP